MTWEDCVELKTSDKKNLLELIHDYCSAAGYKVNVQTPVAFLYTNDEEVQLEIKNKIPFTLDAI